jgi:hypothetical protein
MTHSKHLAEMAGMIYDGEDDSNLSEHVALSEIMSNNAAGVTSGGSGPAGGGAED